MAQWVINGIMGILGIVFLNDSEPGVPSQFTLAGLVLAFVWTYTGLTAQTNTPAPPDPPA
jgi:VIT1/CCC1 family predicted Fe2+/Mn2+ transporter